jgi:nucleoside-diphosphate-sugar epimerase
MNIAIVGGTGTLGRQVVSQLRARGHEVRVLSRNAPEYRVDLTTGDGLDKALAGCDVVVDASNNASRAASATLVDGTRRLLAAGQESGVALTSDHPDVQGRQTFGEWATAQGGTRL